MAISGCDYIGPPNDISNGEIVAQLNSAAEVCMEIYKEGNAEKSISALKVFVSYLPSRVEVVKTTFTDASMISFFIYYNITMRTRLAKEYKKENKADLAQNQIDIALRFLNYKSSLAANKGGKDYLIGKGKQDLFNLVEIADKQNLP